MKRDVPRWAQGKKLIQAWVPAEDHAALTAMADAQLMQVATYLRQVIHEHVAAPRAEIVKAPPSAVANGSAAKVIKVAKVLPSARQKVKNSR